MRDITDDLKCLHAVFLKGESYFELCLSTYKLLMEWQFGIELV